MRQGDRLLSGDAAGPLFLCVPVFETVILRFVKLKDILIFHDENIKVMKVVSHLI